MENPRFGAWWAAKDKTKETAHACFSLLPHNSERKKLKSRPAHSDLELQIFSTGNEGALQALTPHSKLVWLSLGRYGPAGGKMHTPCGSARLSQPRIVVTASLNCSSAEALPCSGRDRGCTEKQQHQGAAKMSFWSSLHLCIHATYTTLQSGHRRGCGSFLKSKQTHTKKSVRKRNISERQLEYKYHLAGLLSVMFEILGTFIILMEMFCTDIDELFRISQEVLKQPPLEKSRYSC